MENENPIVDDLVQEPAQQGAQQPVPQRAPLVILLSPWDGDIDLSTKTSKSLWDEGIKPLENKFSGNGRDLARFLADVTNRAKKCKWLPLLTIRRKSLLSQYGEISMDDVLFEKSLRDHIVPTTLAEARPKVNALMMFHFLYDSLGANPQKKLSTKLGAMDQDGPLLLKTVLDQTFVATQASTFAIKERFYELLIRFYCRWWFDLLFYCEHFYSTISNLLHDRRSYERYDNRRGNRINFIKRLTHGMNYLHMREVVLKHRIVSYIHFDISTIT